MKRKYIVSISIIILTLSMIAIFFLELLQIRSLYQASNDTIERSINEAISQTVIQLQKQDVAIYVYDKVVQAELQNPSGTNEGHNFNSYIGGKSNISKATELNMNFNNNDIEAIELYYMEQFGDPKSEFSKLALQLEAEYTQRKIPIEKRFNSELIGKILTQNLKRNGLELEIEFAIIDEISQKVKISSDDFRVDTYEECYRYNIINGSLTDNPHILAVYTPSKVDVIWNSILYQTLLCVIASVVYLFSFIIAIFSILRQKKLNQVQKDFVNNMTHEFKTPLATIKLAATTISNPQVMENKETLKGMCEIIIQETARMTQNVEQILQLATLDRSKLKLNLSVENANSIVLEVASIMDVPISKRNGQLTVSTCDSVVNINIDVPLMTSVLVNIMDNAIKYSKENLIINISTYVKEDFFFVSIKDNGIGMSEEAQSKIFERFYRVSTNNKHNVKGFGLGLSYAKSIVLAHNGIISVSSKLGSGSTFTIKLPIVKNNKQEDYE